VPYPPKPPRKHRTPEEARAASNKALVPHQFRPGESGNPAGFPHGRREQLEMIEQLARQAAPEAIGILQAMARHSEDDRVRTMAATKLLEFLPKPKEPEADGGWASPRWGPGWRPAWCRNWTSEQLREWLIDKMREWSQIQVPEVPEGFVPTEADRERYALFRFEFVQLVTGIHVGEDGELHDVVATKAAAAAKRARWRNGG
jgi:hypothetical protein